MSTLYRATVTRIDGEGVFVEVPELGGGGEWGPLELLAIPLSEGDAVLVGSIHETLEDLALLGKLVLENPDPLYVPPANSRLIYYFENEAARTAAALTLVSGLTTWLDDEQRLDVYTDEPTAGWVSYYGVKSSRLVYPTAVQIGLGVSVPTASVSVATAASTDRAIDTKATADAVPRLRVNASGLFEWSDGTNAVDVDLQRSANGNAGLLITPRIGVGGAVSGTATVTARQSTNRVGFFSNNTEAAVTHGLAHFYAIEAGNDDSSFIAAYKSGESQPRFYQRINGEQRWGPGGSTATDVNFYRSAVGVLKTDGDLVAGADITALSDVFAANRVMVGPSAVDIGRGIVNSVSSTSPSAAVGSTETVVLTFPSITYKANRAYRVFHEANFTISAAVAAFGNFQLRKTNSSGTVLATFSRFYGNATSTQFSGRASAVFTTGNSDVTAALVVTSQGTASYNVTHWAAAGTPRVCSIYDVGSDIDFPDNPVLT
jgi:hypothetical protein